MPEEDLPNYIELDESIRPQDDFYSYACKKWLQKNPRPKDQIRWNITKITQLKVEKRLQDILDDWSVAGVDLTKEQRQATTYYQALLHKDQNQAKSLKSLRQMRQRIKDGLKGATSAQILGDVLKEFRLREFFALYTDPDNKNSQRFRLHIEPCQLSLPSRDYYLEDDRQMIAIRQKYKTWLKKYSSKLQQLDLASGLEPAEILEIETAIADSIWSPDLGRDRLKAYNPYSWQDLQENFDFDWSTYFQAAGIEPPQEVIVIQPSFLTGVLKSIRDLDSDKLRSYLVHKMTLKYGAFLSEEMAALQFEFFGKVLAGTPKMQALKSRSLAAVNKSFCDVFGRAYVEKHFPAAHKERVLKLAQEVKRAFRRRLLNNTWMSDQSKQLAAEKLNNVVINIGYSQHWTKYEISDLDPQNPVKNAVAVFSMRRQMHLRRLKQQTNRQQLYQSESYAQAVGAWAYPQLLTTSYPAGYLQPPIYDHQASDNYNLGILGATIGHELSHNFDDQGANHDQNGNLNPWLSAKERQNFKKQSQKLIKHASSFQPLPGLYMRGRQVVGEIIADLVGLEVVLDIIKEKYKNQPAKKKEAIRTIFIARAFLWAQNSSDENRIQLAKSGVHPDKVFLVNGIFAHCEDFYKAFDLQPGDKLYRPPKERAKIWWSSRFGFDLRLPEQRIT